MAKKKRAPTTPKKSNNTFIYAGIALLVIIAAFAYISLNRPTEFLTNAYSFEDQIPSQNTSAYSSLDVNPSELGKVRIVEFMKFDCSHCNDLNKEMSEILKNYGDSVEIIYVPVSFEGQSIKSIEAYLIAKEMGKGKEMRDALFNAKFESKRDVMESMLVMKEVAASIGMGTDFNSKLEKGYAEKAALKNNAYAGMYQIKGTPTVLINGKEVNVPDINATISSHIKESKGV
jgi:thiol:disulfide interchange protein DsbA